MSIYEIARRLDDLEKKVAGLESNIHRIAGLVLIEEVGHSVSTKELLLALVKHLRFEITNIPKRAGYIEIKKIV